MTSSVISSVIFSVVFSCGDCLWWFLYCPLWRLLCCRLWRLLCCRLWRLRQAFCAISTFLCYLPQAYLSTYTKCFTNSFEKVSLRWHRDILGNILGNILSSLLCCLPSLSSLVPHPQLPQVGSPRCSANHLRQFCLSCLQSNPLVFGWVVSKPLTF